MTVRRQVELNEQKQRAQSEEQTAQQRGSDFIFLVSSLESRVSGPVSRVGCSYSSCISLHSASSPHRSVAVSFFRIVIFQRIGFISQSL